MKILSVVFWTSETDWLSEQRYIHQDRELCPVLMYVKFTLQPERRSYVRYHSEGIIVSTMDGADATIPVSRTDGSICV